MRARVASNSKRRCLLHRFSWLCPAIAGLPYPAVDRTAPLAKSLVVLKYAGSPASQRSSDGMAGQGVKGGVAPAGVGDVMKDLQAIYTCDTSSSPPVLNTGWGRCTPPVYSPRATRLLPPFTSPKHVKSLTQSPTCARGPVRALQRINATRRPPRFHCPPTQRNARRAWLPSQLCWLGGGEPGG